MSTAVKSPQEWRRQLESEIRHACPKVRVRQLGRRGKQYKLGPVSIVIPSRDDGIRRGAVTTEVRASIQRWRDYSREQADTQRALIEDAERRLQDMGEHAIVITNGHHELPEPPVDEPEAAPVEVEAPVADGYACPHCELRSHRPQAIAVHWKHAANRGDHPPFVYKNRPPAPTVHPKRAPRVLRATATHSAGTILAVPTSADEALKGLVAYADRLVEFAAGFATFVRGFAEQHAAEVAAGKVRDRRLAEIEGAMEKVRGVWDRGPEKTTKGPRPWE